MPTITFTARGVDALLRKRHMERVDYFDAAMAGLCLRVGPRGGSWFYMRRLDGKFTRLSLGSHADLDRVGKASSPPKAAFTIARERAGAVESTIAQGKHPKAERAREQAALREARAIDQGRLVRVVGEEWAKHHLPGLRKSTQQDYRRGLDEFLAAFGNDDIGVLRRGQLLRHLDKIKARSPTAANRQAVVIRLLFAYARDRFDLENNPASDIRNPAKQNKRSRTLDRNEIRILWHACELAGYPYGHALQMALCTGQRIGEIGSMCRDHIDSTGHYWQQSDENKSGRRIDIYLGKRSKAILANCPNLGRHAPYFSASTDRDGNPRGLRSDTWNNALDRHIAPQLEVAAASLGLPTISKGWTAHDLRRTVRTALTGWCGVSPDTAERVLNHAMGGLRAVYDHADYRPHVAEALQKWDRELTKIVEGKADALGSVKSGTKKRGRDGHQDRHS